MNFDQFKLYEEEFLKLLFVASTGVSKAKGMVMSNEKLIGVLENMKNGYNSMGNYVEKLTDLDRSQYESRMSYYKKKVSELKDEVEKRKLFDPNSFSQEDEEKLKNIDLEGSLAIGIQVSEIGHNNLTLLKTQGDIIRNNKKEKNIKNIAKQSDKAQTNINIQRMRIKISMMFIIFQEIVIILLTLYLKLR